MRGREAGAYVLGDVQEDVMAEGLDIYMALPWRELLCEEEIGAQRRICRYTTVLRCD